MLVETDLRNEKYKDMGAKEYIRAKRQRKREDMINAALPKSDDITAETFVPSRYKNIYGGLEPP